jgi:hypothetical protein
MAAAPTAKRLNENFSQAWITQASSYVDHVFDNAADRSNSPRRNPFTGADWDPDLDPIEPQKEEAVRAVLARRWHEVLLIEICNHCPSGITNEKT